MLLKRLVVCMSVLFLIVSLYAVTVTAGGPPLKENTCASCHKDFAAIFPKGHPDMGKGQPCMSCHTPDPAAGPTKFSEYVHKVHKEGKAKLECAACHKL